MSKPNVTHDFWVVQVRLPWKQHFENLCFDIESWFVSSNGEFYTILTKFLTYYLQNSLDLTENV